METMNWKSFKELLENNKDLHLQFRYDDGKFVDNSFHITEIKLAPITSVDCDGVMNKWTEVIMQLWEPDEKQTERSMKVGKALSIIAIVEKILPLDDDADLKIEFGNSQFDTRQMLPAYITAESDTLTVNLSPGYVQCKAQTVAALAEPEIKARNAARRQQKNQNYNSKAWPWPQKAAVHRVTDVAE